MDVKQAGDIVDMGSWKVRITGVLQVLYTCESIDGRTHYTFHDCGRVKKVQQ